MIQPITAAVYSGESLKQASLQIRVGGKIAFVHVLQFANKKKPIRFCVGNQSLHSSVWSVFANSKKSDVYVAIRSSASLHKISLHESGDFRHQLIGMTIETLSRSDLATTTMEDDGNDIGRILHRWSRPEAKYAGWTDCMGGSVPGRDLEAGTGNFSDVMWIPQPKASDAVEFRFFLIDPNKGQFDLRPYLTIGGSFSVVDGFKLANGEVLVVLSFTYLMSPELCKGIESGRRRGRKKTHTGFDWSTEKGPRVMITYIDEDDTPSFFDVKAFR